MFRELVRRTRSVFKRNDYTVVSRRRIIGIARPQRSSNAGENDGWACSACVPVRLTIRLDFVA